MFVLFYILGENLDMPRNLKLLKLNYLSATDALYCTSKDLPSNRNVSRPLLRSRRKGKCICGCNFLCKFKET